MKKVFALLLMLALVLSLTACDSSDYKEAMELFNSEKYSDAVTIFEELGDYEDSAQMALKCKYEMALSFIEDGEFDSAKELLVALDDYENCPELLKSIPWKTFHAYLKEEGSVEIKNPDPEYTVKLATSGDDIVASYLFDAKDVGMYMYCAVVLTEDGTNNELTANATFSFLAAYMADEASTIWDTNSYKRGDTVTWTEYNCTGKKADGSSLDAGTTGLCHDPEASLERLTDGIKKVLDESGLGIKMADIGFGSY